MINWRYIFEEARDLLELAGTVIVLILAVVGAIHLCNVFGWL